MWNDILYCFQICNNNNTTLKKLPYIEYQVLISKESAKHTGKRCIIFMNL